MAAIPPGRHHLEHVIESHDLISPSDHTLDLDALKDKASSLKASIHSTIHGHDYHEGRRFHGHKKGS
ncbi:hypothetical protein CLAFUW4_08197 [Fulvia fulva]|uniref:Uncharacterized protein n=1 Tax=Passalora fulva TaxID=5499 RepID=A0A9Q8P677_PASFU|nr:uncharacterized protein CLAFUR5_08310 [Fulvia fulva]KAK4628840.1 hypothetical protein CLAFUR4_08202 [Fulvia fulva]KAK4630311.1 hypothetical protein CLAFUR0_08197 [Fulvia fulva]UJO14880.1 hypothetical protein CLAFUR5_08310 [Fulvia fulva]WPV12812.1 hypothetical protein CLAFUW4_08197 [Fulvia fulva]WPV27154.1 hypothetical protein CLAFUW7_08197 [Fulvia fulva]